MANKRELSEAEQTSESSKSKYINGFEKFLLDELKCRIVPGYSKSPSFVKMRPALIAYATKYKSESEDVFFPVIAATIEYADLFLSRKKKIPVVVANRDAKLHFQMFVLGCAMLAYKDYNIFDDMFTEADFVEEHNVAKARYILDMRDRIREGIDGVKQPPKSPWDGLDDFYDLLTMDEDISLHHLRLPMWEILVAIRRDIKFTEFKQSTLVAAAVLVMSLKFQPELYSWFSIREFSNVITSPLMRRSVCSSQTTKAVKRHTWC